MILSSLMYTIKHPQVKSFDFFFPICILLIFLSCLIVLTKILSIILNKYEESVQPYLVPYFNRVTLNFFQFKLLLVVYLLCIALIKCRHLVLWTFFRALLSQYVMPLFSLKARKSSIFFLYFFLVPVVISVESYLGFMCL